jgi:hypothetical protein
MDYLRVVAACVLLASCASTVAPMPVETTVRAWPSGLSLMFSELRGRIGLVVEVHDHGGSNEMLLWQIPDVQAHPGYQRLVACVEDVRAKAPRDLRNAALRCVETSGMPSPEVIPEPDATEYRVQITVGILGARRRLRSVANARMTSVAQDVDQCMHGAEEKGVAIQPLLARFDSCLRKRAYLVDEPPK